MTKDDRKIDARIVWNKLEALGLTPTMNGNRIVYAQKVPNNLLMRALAVSQEMFDLIKEKQNG